MNTKPKEFKRYFLEFILIFLAVSLSFIAENFRESSADQKNAKTLAISLVNDIENDLQFIKEAIVFSEQKILSSDSLLTILSNNRKSWNVKSIYYNMNYISQSVPFFPTTGTYNQIVTSGSLKNFDQSIVNQMNLYHMQLSKIKYWAEIEDKTLWLMADIIWVDFNVAAMSEIRFNKDITENLFFTIKDNKISAFKNLIAAVQTYRIKTLVEFKKQEDIANKLIEKLSKRYDIEKK